MDILRARRLHLMKPKEFSPATRQPTLYYRTASSNSSHFSKIPRISSRPENSLNNGPCFIKTNLQRIGRSLEQLQTNFEEEQTEITREFERKLTQVSSSITRSINDIRERLDVLTSLIGRGDISRDSALTDSRSEELLSVSKSDDSLDQTVFISPTESLSFPFQSPLSSCLKSESFDHVNQRSYSENSSAFGLQSTSKHYQMSNSLDRIDACSNGNIQLLEAQRSISNENAKSTDSGLGSFHLKDCSNGNTGPLAKRTLSGIDYPYGTRRQWRPMRSENYLELMKRAYCNWVPKSSYSSSGNIMDTAVNHKNTNSMHHSENKSLNPMPTLDSDDVFNLSENGDINTFSDQTMASSRISDEVSEATALEWRSHNRFNPMDYRELPGLKVEPPPSRYPPWLYPEFHNRYPKKGNYPNEPEPQRRETTSAPHFLNSEPDPKEQWQWGVSRKLWQGWTLPGLNEEVEKELVIKLCENRVFRGELIDAHNTLRRCHGSPKLAEVDDLTRDAQMWADIIAEKGFTQYSELPGRGESIALLDTNGKELHGGDVSKLWYSENEEFDYSDPKWRKATMNFTQMIWKSSTDIGIGVAKVKDKDKCVVVVQYRPLGNGNRPGEFRKNVPAPQ